VLVVEDHPLVAEATGLLLAGCGGLFNPVISSTAAQAIERLDDRSCQWFRILLDLDVPGAYGLSLAREVENRGMAGRCCVVSAFDTPEYVAEIWSRGFLGYITKAIPVAAFTAALMTVLGGKRSFPFTSSATNVTGVRLTRRQTQLLESIRAGRSSKEIANELHIAEGTVNNHVAAILQSLDASSRAHAVARAIELGFLESRPQRMAAEREPIICSRRW
jgi:DNA-binding NarL/FixJ family response regulator